MRLGHRYYDASVGRFISRDPIQDGDNWHAYCNNDPINDVDPEGLQQKKKKKGKQKDPPLIDVGGGGSKGGRSTYVHGGHIVFYPDGTLKSCDDHCSAQIVEQPNNGNGNVKVGGGGAVSWLDSLIEMGKKWIGL